MTSNNSSFISETLRQLDELNAETYLSAADKRYNQAERLEMMADAETNQAKKAALRAAAGVLSGKMDKLQARADKKDHEWRDPAQLDELRKAGLGSAPPPRRQDESKVFRIYRNSDQSATVVMESGVAVWLAPKSVNKVLSESGNINRTKLHRLLESRIWK